MENEHTPPDVREGVRTGILTSLRKDLALRGGRTARLLVAAGVTGVVGAIGITFLVSGHPYDHHPPWHVVAFSAVWAGLFVVTLAVAFLQIRTPTLPLARSAYVGILGVGLAGICGATCPDQHFLNWWSGTAVGGQITEVGGMVLGALCFGLVTSLFFGGVAAFLALGDRRWGPVRPLLPAGVLLLLLSPGVVLQSIGLSWGVLAGWLLGTAGGSYAGVATGIRLRGLLGTG